MLFIILSGRFSRILVFFRQFSGRFFRPISLKTGRAVVDSVKSMGLSVRSVDLSSPEQAIKLVDSLDLVFIALHGRGREDGFIQAILEEKNIQYRMVQGP